MDEPPRIVDAEFEVITPARAPPETWPADKPLPPDLPREYRWYDRRQKVIYWTVWALFIVIMVPIVAFAIGWAGAHWLPR